MVMDIPHYVVRVLDMQEVGMSLVSSLVVTVMVMETEMEILVEGNFVILVDIVLVDNLVQEMAMEFLFLRNISVSLQSIFRR